MRRREGHRWELSSTLAANAAVYRVMSPGQSGGLRGLWIRGQYSPAVPTEPPITPPADDLFALFGCVTVRTGELTASTTLEVKEALQDRRGALRMGAITYAVDVATGMSMGVAVLDRGMWVVTTDLDVHLASPVTTGPLRIEVEVLRAGATTTVAAFSLHDEARDRCVGGGTATGRPFPFEFDRSFLDFPMGTPIDHGRGRAAAVGTRAGATLAGELGFRVDEDATVEVDLADWLRNPWGILHGGVTACLVDVAGEMAGCAVLGGPVRPTGEMLRYLAPGRIGPVRALPRVLTVGDGRVLVETRVVDVGADGRLLAAGVTELVAAPR